MQLETGFLSKKKEAEKQYTVLSQVHSWNGGSKLLNPNKYVKCLSLVHGKLYCGCQDSSIQVSELEQTIISINTSPVLISFLFSDKCKGILVFRKLI